MKIQHTLRSTLSLGLWLALFSLTSPLIAAAQEKIVFQSNRTGDSEIWVMNPDGTGQFNLTNNAASDFDPSISADGSKIAFASNRTGDSEIWVMNADGSNQINLTNNPASDFDPSFSPDGSKIAFASNRDGNLEIYVMNADGSNETRLTFVNPASDGSPSFSPDGSKIAFSSSRDGDLEIYVMNADGSNQFNLTNNPASDFDPSFSPDGSKITFVIGLSSGEIYVMNSDGTGQMNLTNNPGIDSTPSFSPDGSKIAFSSSRDGNEEIYVMDADGSNPMRLTTTIPFSDSNPSWGIISPPPVLSNVAVTSPISESDSATLSGNLSSPTAGDSFTLTVDWGDGSAPQIFNYPAGTTSFAETHQYADDDPTATPSDNYTVNLTLTAAGGSDTDAAVVTVNNAAPVVSNLAFNPPAVVATEPATLNGNVADAGTLDTHTVVIDWGDGSPTTTLNLAAGVTAFDAAHTYTTLGSFTVSVTATDDDGGADSETLNIATVPPPPPAAPTNLRVETVGANQVSLRWTDNANNETGFAIEQCRSQNCNNFVEVGQVGANVTTFLHTGLLANTQFTYRVRAFNLGGNSVYSNAAKVKTLRR